MLNAHGQTEQVPNSRSEPILFAARTFAMPPDQNIEVAAGTSRTEKAPKHGQRAYVVHFELPAAAFHRENLDADHLQLGFRAAVIALDQYGSPVSRDLREVKVKIQTKQLNDDPKANFGYDVHVNLPRGNDYLYLAVWDVVTGRLGTLEVPVEVTGSGSPANHR